jgi:hypothetical protein
MANCVLRTAQGESKKEDKGEGESERENVKKFGAGVRVGWWTEGDVNRGTSGRKEVLSAKTFFM